MRLMAMILLAAMIHFSYLFEGCGEDDSPACPNGTKPIGWWKAEELNVMKRLLEVMMALDLPQPDFFVRLLRTEDECRKYELPTNPDSPDGWAKGQCKRRTCTILIRRFGNAEDHFLSLLIHELVHAIGYEHGEEMIKLETIIRYTAETYCDSQIGRITHNP